LVLGAGGFGSFPPAPSNLRLLPSWGKLTWKSWEGVGVGEIFGNIENGMMLHKCKYELMKKEKQKNNKRKN
jgi:hypothetical protein